VSAVSLTLRRLERNGFATYGQIVDDVEKAVCVTLERPWADNAPNVSSIPAGTFTFHRRLSPKRGYDVFITQDVPGRSDIEIHKGNLPSDSEGCILVGSTFGDLDAKHGITGSANAFERFMDRLKGVDSFTLTVIDP
jgi:hypothetical protein